MTKLATMSKKAINVTSRMVPRDAGNFPLITHCWLCRYLLYPRNKTSMLMPRNVAPRGFPMWRSFRKCASSVVSWVSVSAREVFNRNSCVMAMPIDAKARDVRSHARNVRSIHERRLLMSPSPGRCNVV